MRVHLVFLLCNFQLGVVLLKDNKVKERCNMVSGSLGLGEPYYKSVRDGFREGDPRKVYTGLTTALSKFPGVIGAVFSGLSLFGIGGSSSGPDPMLSSLQELIKQIQGVRKKIGHIAESIQRNVRNIRVDARTLFLVETQRKHDILHRKFERYNQDFNNKSKAFFITECQDHPYATYPMYFMEAAIDTSPGTLAEIAMQKFEEEYKPLFFQMLFLYIDSSIMRSACNGFLFKKDKDSVKALYTHFKVTMDHFVTTGEQYFKRSKEGKMGPTAGINYREMTKEFTSRANDTHASDETKFFDWFFDF